MSKAKFTRHLKELNIEELRHELLDIYVKVPAVKDYYAMELGSAADRKKIYDRAKQEIAAKYATKSFRRPRRPRIQKINQILSRMAKATVFQHELADLYMFDVEAALVFIAKYHYYSTTLGSHISQTYGKALMIVDREMVQDEYQQRALDCLERSIYMIDLHRAMDRTYRACFD